MALIESERRVRFAEHRDPQARQRAKEIFQDWRKLKSAGRDYDDRLWQDFREALDEFWEGSKHAQRQRIEAEIEKVEAMIEKAKTSLEANEERLSNARSDDYADRVREPSAKGDGGDFPLRTQSCRSSRSKE